MSTIEELKAFAEAQELTQGQLAAKLGVSTATVNQYLQGKYKGDTAALDAKAVQLMARSREKAKEVKQAFVETTSAKNMLEICGLAHALSDIYLIIGDAGLGKTVALREYARRHPDVILLETEPTYNAKVLLQSLCDALGLSASRTNHEMMSAVVDKLKDSERLLIVDEAELLAIKPLEILRRIHDLTGIGMVLAGMPRLRANLRGARGQYKQLYSRVGFCHDLRDRLPEGDIAQMCEAVLGTAEHNPQLYKVSGGNARRLSKLLRGVMKMAENHGGEVTTRMIDRFAEMLID
ncbi:MAG: AAA family ATPase [Cardiobacterium hominis]